MKWNDVYVLSVGDDDSIIDHSALAWSTRYRVPMEKCFVDKDRPADPPLGFSRLNENSLRSATLGSKIIIISHALFAGIHYYDKRHDGASFAKYLFEEAGLRTAGLIAFKGCELGQDRFLHDFKDNLSSMQVGWLIGYKESTTTKRYDDSVFEVIDSDFHEFSRNRAFKSCDDKRVTIVKGNCNVIPPNGFSSRYGN